MKPRTVHCAECGQPFLRKRAEAVFCSAGCRKAFNNRRQVRGAELYDLFMAMRFDRGTAKDLGLWNRACRMAAAFRLEDQQVREGRPSWRAPGHVMARRADLAATFIGTVRGGGRAVWDRHALDRAFDALPGSGTDDAPNPWDAPPAAL